MFSIMIGKKWSTLTIQCLMFLSSMKLPHVDVKNEM